MNIKKGKNTIYIHEDYSNVYFVSVYLGTKGYTSDEELATLPGLYQKLYDHLCDKFLGEKKPVADNSEQYFFPNKESVYSFAEALKKILKDNGFKAKIEIA